MLKPLKGVYELLLTHQKLSGSDEDHTALRIMEPVFLQGQSQKIKSWLKNQTLLSVDQKKGLEITPSLEKERQVVLTSSRTPQGPQRKQEGPRTKKGKGKHKANYNRPYPQGYRIPKLEPSAIESVINMARTLMEFTPEEKRIERPF
ncbi:hypothetical protein O181_008595 [Austropuccinia psidii MF-1]|uniref:Uncharacterized protein n=1 Tax=Austropuccinia psidii MF-1 TaxID=1389203 RepID=A0A9Q3GJ17_9BASI|nr:hypothetical protein [Austropuccinia psidii MF-1]